MTTWLLYLLDVAGVFTLVLGVAHFALPALLDFKTVVMAAPAAYKPPRPLRLWPTRYIVRARDRYGVVWVMNHAASYALVAIGVVDLLAAQWPHGALGRWLALWIAGWWLLRAANQLIFGRRWGDWLILAWFAALGLVHLWAAIVV